MEFSDDNKKDRDDNDKEAMTTTTMNGNVLLPDVTSTWTNLLFDNKAYEMVVSLRLSVSALSFSDEHMKPTPVNVGVILISNRFQLLFTFTSCPVLFPI